MFQETTKLWLNGMLCFKKQEECDKMESFVFQGAARVWQNRKLYFKEQQRLECDKFIIFWYSKWMQNLCGKFLSEVKFL